MKVKRPFRFEDMWLGTLLLRILWVVNGMSNEVAIFSLMNRLSYLMDDITNWNKSCFENVRQRMRALEKELESISNLPRMIENQQWEDGVRNQMTEWCIREEILWRQRSRVQWLKKGDKNTRFFHRGLLLDLDKMVLRV